ncbi:MAG: FliA/WhiG family RNA polymerase sigma factor [Peptococcaceae bacterium]|nr:FliA/WhiG family RNA polymerase sigma factor [Peptococcaceae bacterium]
MAAIKKVWFEYYQTKAPELREQLILEYLPLVKTIAGRLAVRFASYIDQEDLESYGVFGLIEAVEKFNPHQGVDFEAFAYRRVRGAILDQVRKMSWLPRPLWQKLQHLNNVRERLERESGGPVPDAEVAAAAGLELAEFTRLTKHFYTASVSSLDEAVALPGGEQVSWGDRVEDPHGTDPLHVITEREDHELLEQAVNDLDEKDRLVLALYYQDGLTLKEIGLVLGVSESRVCQLHGRAIKRLRDKLAALQSPEGGRTG